MSDEPKRWRGVCFGGCCAFGPCSNSKALVEALADIVEQEDNTTIGRLVKAGKGCTLCDRVARLPQPVRKRKLTDEDVTARDVKLTRIQQGKATTTEEKRS